jgi:putative endopeptidase
MTPILERTFFKHPEEIDAFAKAFSEAPIQEIKAFIKTQYLEYYLGVLPKRFYQAFLDYTGYSAYSRVDRARDLVNALLEDEVQQTFDFRRVKAEQRAYISKMFKDIKFAAQSHYRKVKGISPERRTQILRKLDTLNIIIGRRDPIGYSDYIVVRSDLFGNVQRGEQNRYRRMLKRLEINPVAFGYTSTGDKDSDGYYRGDLNTVVISENAANRRTHVLDEDAAIMYGRLGSMLGHEIFHAVGQFQAVSPPANNKDDAYLARMKDKVVRNYTYTDRDGVTLSGSHHLSQNEAEVMDLNAAFSAYQTSLGRSSSPVIDNRTGEQRFFLAYAQTGHHLMHEQPSVQEAKDLGHLPRPFSINATAACIQGFYDAFKVQPADALFIAPDRRIRF